MIRLRHALEVAEVVGGEVEHQEQRGVVAGVDEEAGGHRAGPGRGRGAGDIAAHVPRRRCVGCGRTAPKFELVRIAAMRDRDGGARRAVQDRAGTMPGRGAYVCRAGESEAPAEACLAQAVRRGGIARALRAAVTLDPKLVELVNS